MKYSKYHRSKYFVYFMFFVLAFLGASVVYAATTSKLSFCDYGGVRRTFMIFGIVINLIKIAAPLILIATGMMAVFKVVISGKDDDLKASFLQLVKQAIAGVVIFLLPSMIDFVFDSLVDTDTSSFAACETCLLDTDNCTIPDEDPVIYTED